jgi:hypothetical protein
MIALLHGGLRSKPGLGNLPGCFFAFVTRTMSGKICDATKAFAAWEYKDKEIMRH